jgi:hypothetical protein
MVSFVDVLGQAAGIFAGACGFILVAMALERFWLALILRGRRNRRRLC